VKKNLEMIARLNFEDKDNPLNQGVNSNDPLALFLGLVYKFNTLWEAEGGWFSTSLWFKRVRYSSRSADDWIVILTSLPFLCVRAFSPVVSGNGPLTRATGCPPALSLCAVALTTAASRLVPIRRSSSAWSKATKL